MTQIVGVFDDGQKAAEAITTVKAAGEDRVTAYSPTPNHDIDHALDVKVSPVRMFILVGGLLGCWAGFALPIYTVNDWPLITGGKALISIPAFVVIAFELMILLAALAGMASFLLLSGLPSPWRKTITDPRFSNDRYGVVVTCGEAQAPHVRAKLRRLGAEEVQTHA